MLRLLYSRPLLNACGEQAIDALFALSPHSDAGPPLDMTLARRKSHNSPIGVLAYAEVIRVLVLIAPAVVRRDSRSPMGVVLRKFMKLSRCGSASDNQ